MKSLVYQGSWQLSLINQPPLLCQSDEDVVVRVKTCGICGTDLGIVSGAYPVAVAGVTLGHEAAGVVEEVGNSVTHVKPGDRVVIDPTYSCGHCGLCRTGRTNHCLYKNGRESGVSADGAFAELYRTTERFVHRIDDDLPFAAASFTEPLSCAISGVNMIHIPSMTARTCIIGAGPMGFLYYRILRLKGLTPFMIESNAARFQYARTIVSAETVFPDWNQALATLDAVNDPQWDLVIDTSGRMLEVAYPCMAPGGTFLSVGLKSQPSTIDTIKLADKSLSIIGSIDSVNGSFLEALHLIQSKLLKVDDLISHNLPLCEYKKAFALVGCDLDQKRLVPITEQANKIMLHI
jgi:threonine dehydrogenase-like Zn-dependent dehydrogenase